MKRSRFTEEQIIGILREQESGAPVMDLRRKHGLSSPTFYKWKAKFGGLDVSEVSMAPGFSSEVAPENSPVGRLAISHNLDRRLRFLLAALGA